MVKVTMLKAEGRAVDLLPETYPLWEVYMCFQAEPAGCINAVNGKVIEQEDVDKTLSEFSVDSEVQLICLPLMKTCSPEEGPF